jgi:hypothetical protein
MVKIEENYQKELARMEQDGRWQLISERPRLHRAVTEELTAVAQSIYP